MARFLGNDRSYQWFLRLLMAARPRLLVLQTLDLVKPVLLLLVSITITRNARCQAAACGAGCGGS
jgi:hypothetical protein